jgi:DNA-binding PadR family transcriptional regulator
MKPLKKEKNRDAHLQLPSITAKVLLAIAREIDEYVTSGQRPVAVMKHGMDGIRFFRQVQKQKIAKQMLKRLEERKYIAISEEADRYHISLTEKGLYESLRLRILESNFLEDGSVCMVVFDIPEKKRSLRTSLRGFLAKVNFVPIQRSVWISPLDAGDTLADLFAASGASKWVSIYTAQRHDAASNKGRSDVI